MGGHSAWRKRVARSELAKGSGGAILRHRPRLGRRGGDLKLNRLGNIGGRPNPKKAKKRINDTKLPLEEKGNSDGRSAVILIQKFVLGIIFGLVSMASALLLWTRETHWSKN